MPSDLAKEIIESFDNSSEGYAVAAIFDADVETFKNCIESNDVSINACDNVMENSFLHMVIAACERGGPEEKYWENKKIPKETAQELVTFILTKKPDVTKENTFKITPLSSAARFKQEELGKLILHYMCEPN